MHALGRKPTARVIGKEVVTADATVASRLALTKRRSASSEFVACAWRMVFPSSFDETFLPLEIGKKNHHQQLKVEPIFSLLETQIRVPLIEAEYKLDAVPAENEVAAGAESPSDRSPILSHERTSYRQAPSSRLRKAALTEGISSSS